MILAGYETTANALGFTLYLLAHHPEVQNRLAAEVDAVLGLNRHPGYGDLERLPYMDACLRETLRCACAATCAGQQRLLCEYLLLPRLFLSAVVILLACSLLLSCSTCCRRSCLSALSTVLSSSACSAALCSACCRRLCLGGAVRRAGQQSLTAVLCCV